MKSNGIQMSANRPFYRKKRILIPLLTVFIVGILILWYFFATFISPPEIADRRCIDWKVTQLDSGLYSYGNNWFKQSVSGLWELYLEGSPFERGVANGRLTHELIYKQEDAFVKQIKSMIPSPFYQRFLKYFIYWFNRKLDHYLMEEFKQEIYGISFSASDSFNMIGNPYQRLLNYHSAHDIGHALQDLMLVGCTSFGVWDEYSSDSSLLIGRNFDFYLGDDFAKNKIICFEKPDHGYSFMMVTWGGMIGTVSGMNEKGITVTINGAKSKIPLSARTPISILAREILQYAGSISDAIHIAEVRKTFVSESLLIGSGDENRAVIIEKAPFGQAVYEPVKNYLICTNHFQSDLFREDPLNVENIRDQASFYRYKRVAQEIGQLIPMNPTKAALLLRNQEGLHGTDIGMGNEKAINQLIAHHSIIFKPGQRLVWISTSPWQLGEYVCYDLTKIFHTFAQLRNRLEVTEEKLKIPADPFQGSARYIQFLRFKEMRSTLLKALDRSDFIRLDSRFFATFQKTNPCFYEVWSLTGDYYVKTGYPDSAVAAYRKALILEIPRRSEKEKIIRSLKEIPGQ